MRADYIDNSEFRHQQVNVLSGNEAKVPQGSDEGTLCQIGKSQYKTTSGTEDSYLPKIHMLKPSPNVRVLGGGVFGK